MIARVDRYQQTHPWAGFPIAVLYKYVDDQGSYLAALITYYAFLSILPLLLLLTTVLGFVLAHHPEVRQQILHSAVSQLPTMSKSLTGGRSLTGSGTGLAIGLIGTVYGGLGVAQATQNAMNVMWAVPRNRRPNPLLARVRSLQLLGTVGIAVLVTTVLTALLGRGGYFAHRMGAGVAIATTVFAVLLNMVVFVMAFRVATARPLSLHDVVPGGVAAAIAWQLLQWGGASYVSHVVRRISETNGVFAVVLGLLAFVYLEAAVVVVCVEINVVRSTRLWPRALATPFTDNVVLTAADRTAYTSYAQAQRTKGFETVDVGFEPPPEDPPAVRG